MRFFLAGILIFLTPVAASAQITGEVEAIGFNNLYRPDCWTPMLVRLNPQGGQTGLYKLQVRQRDLDGDLPTFERDISLTAESGARDQRFWTYFIPTPINRGLPDVTSGGTLANLQEELRVFLTDADGKQIAQLPITAPITNIDPLPRLGSERRGVKLILCVNDGRSQPQWSEYQSSGATGILGILEDVMMVTLRTAALPENPLGFDAVDAIVWMDADPAELKRGGDAKWQALTNYVRNGGRLIICQTPEWQRTAAFGDLLPVTILGVDEKLDPNPLRQMAMAGAERMAFPERNTWDRLQGPFRLARAEAHPDTIVEEWVFWDLLGDDRTPYIVRKPYGLGSVTWVAQDLGDPAISMRSRWGWPFIWDAVFGWKNEPLLTTPQTDDRLTMPYAPGPGVDLGQSLLRQTEHTSRTASLIALAIAFFVVYWIIAGPGLYAYLFSKRKTDMSWFMFGASALAATALTMLIVKLVLRGPPELKHVTVVKVAPGQPAVAQSRFGLYIPRDGDQAIQLERTAPGAVSSINAFAAHPANLIDSPLNQTGRLSYTVPIIDLASEEPARITVPYRSSLKKFEARWIGELDGAIEGTARLVDQGTIAGTLTNGTGQPLQNIYIAFREPAWGDWVLYLPSWEQGITIDLAREFNRGGADGRATPLLNPQNRVTPDDGVKVRERLALWEPYWYSRFRVSLMSETSGDDSDERVRRSFPMLSLFDRLRPVKKADRMAPDRYELLRRGARHLDISAALAAGSLVVLAELHEAPLPFPMRVDGDPVAGRGTIFYQFVLPLDESQLSPLPEALQPKPPPIFTTAPSTQPRGE